MQWRYWLRSFGPRFGVSLAVLGIGYFIIFGLHPAVKQLTPVERYQRLQLSFRQLYLTSAAINAFSTSGPGAQPALDNLKQQLQNNLSTATSALTDAPKDYDSYHQRNASAILARITTAQQQFNDHYTILNKVIEYNPSDDISGLDANNDSLIISQRAKATVLGLTAAINGPAKGLTGANSGVSTIAGLTPDLNNQLNREITCYAGVANLEAAGQHDAAYRGIQTCINTYETLRSAAVDDLKVPFSDDFLSGIAPLQIDFNNDIASRIKQLQ